MAARRRDPVSTLYRTLLVCGAAGVLILVAGAVEYVHFEPFAAQSGVQAHITGVFAYDAVTHQTTGPDRRTFNRDDGFAAVVDWSSLPPDLLVQAVWYDSFGNVVGQSGPARASDLNSRTVVPAELPQGLPYHLPGEYIFAVERVQNGEPVEVLARRLIEVERT